MDSERINGFVNTDVTLVRVIKAKEMKPKKVSKKNEAIMKDFGEYNHYNSYIYWGVIFNPLPPHSLNH